MVYRTVKDWNLRGKRIKSGQRAAAWTTSGESLFASYQVRNSDASRRRILRSIFDII